MAGVTTATRKWLWHTFRLRREALLSASENNPVVGQSVRDFFAAALRRVGVAVLSHVRPCTTPRSRSSALGSLRHQIQSTDRWSVCQN
jgi:hypothetical protein